MKLGIIRCAQTEDMCPGSTCFKVARTNKCAFEGIDSEIEVIGFVTCGGCSGKKAIPRAEMLVKRGAEAVAFASCITKGTPIGVKCPHREEMIRAIKSKLGEDIAIIEYTH